ncbi:hypothetical protein [Nonomuraea cavernae]|uniref:hypothetical protein n=1 Tax=Nonomuraea cavernae TaxID=2045107 RepID=UPI0033C47BE6
MAANFSVPPLRMPHRYASPPVGVRLSLWSSPLHSSGGSQSWAVVTGPRDWSATGRRQRLVRDDPPQEVHLSGDQRDDAEHGDGGEVERGDRRREPAETVATHEHSRGDGAAKAPHPSEPPRADLAG